MKKMNKKLIISILVIFLLLLLSVTSKAWTVPADTAEANNDGGNRWWYSYGYVCREHGAGWHALETPGWSGSNPGEYWGRRTHYIYTYSGSVDYTNNTNVAFAAYAYGHGETLQHIIWGESSCSGARYNSYLAALRAIETGATITAVPDRCYSDGKQWTVKYKSMQCSLGGFEGEFFEVNWYLKSNTGEVIQSGTGTPPLSYTFNIVDGWTSVHLEFKVYVKKIIATGYNYSCNSATYTEHKYYSYTGYYYYGIYSSYYYGWSGGWGSSTATCTWSSYDHREGDSENGYTYYYRVYDYYYRLIQQYNATGRASGQPLVRILTQLEDIEIEVTVNDTTIQLIQKTTYTIEIDKYENTFWSSVTDVEFTFSATCDGGYIEYSTTSKSITVTTQTDETHSDTIVVTESYINDDRYNYLWNKTFTIEVTKVYKVSTCPAESGTVSGASPGVETTSLDLSGGSAIIKVHDEADIDETETEITLIKYDVKDTLVDMADLAGATFEVKIEYDLTRIDEAGNAVPIEGISNEVRSYTISSGGAGITISDIHVWGTGTITITITEIAAPKYYYALTGSDVITITTKPDQASWSYVVESKTGGGGLSGEGNRYGSGHSTFDGETDSIYNARKFIDVSGFVWEDIKNGKESSIDGIKNSSEPDLSGIIVTINGERTIYSDIPMPITTTTDENGQYSFYVPMGTTYSITFTYNGYNYQHTLGGKDSISYEDDAERDAFNERLATIGTDQTVEGVAISNKDNELGPAELGPAGSNSSIYAINAYCTETFGLDENVQNVSGLNLGITLRETADMAIRKDVYKVNLAVNGKDQDYMYNRRELTTDGEDNKYWDVSARASDVYYTDNYTREIKISDYNAVSNTQISEKLKAEVTYVIRVRNQSGELNCKIEELVDYFDADYTFKEAYTSEGSVKTSTSSSYNHPSGRNVSNYNKIYLQLHKDLAPGEDYIVYVVFEVKTDENGYIAMDTQDSDSKGNMVEITGYSTTYASNAKAPNGTEYKPGDIAGRIDVDSNPGNATSIDESTFEDDTDRAPYIRFVFAEHERILSGTVWQDLRTEEVAKAMIGDGVRQNGEALLNGIEVTLYERKTDNLGNVTDVEAQYWNGSTWTTAKMDTTTIQGLGDGSYLFESITAGDYYIQFKYEDGQNYKSTKFNYEEVCEGFDYNNPDILGAYTETSTPYSDARDLWGDETTLGTRAYVNNLLAGQQTYEKLENYTSLDKSVKAVTGLINVNVEKTVETNSSTGITKLVKRDVEYTNNSLEYNLNGIDFGIVERPKAELKLTKEVANLKITLANGNVLFDADGTSDVSNLIWINKVPHEVQYNNNMITSVNPRANAGTILVTMDSELMHGAEIKIKYKLKVDNVGEVDYASKKFYYIGSTDGDESPVATTVDKIIDYAGASGSDDPSISRNNLLFYESENSGTDWKKISLDELYSSGLIDTISANKLLSDNGAGSYSGTVSQYKTILVNEVNAALIPELAGSGNSSIEIPLILSRSITEVSKDDNLSYGNMAEIVCLKNDVGKRTTYSTVGNQDPDDQIQEIDGDLAQQITILPPFGDKD